MVLAYLMGLVEHVRPPRLDFWEAEIQRISADLDSWRLALSFSASDTSESTDLMICEMDRVEQDLPEKYVPRYHMRGTIFLLK